MYTHIRPALLVRLLLGLALLRDLRRQVIHELEHLRRGFRIKDFPLE